MKLTDEQLDAILGEGGLELAQPYSPRGSYRKNEWLLTRCRACGTLAHYRLAYVLEKNVACERTCRACFWLGWHEENHALQASIIQKHLDEGYELDYLIDSGFVPRPRGVDWDKASSLAEESGYTLVGLLHGKREGDDVMIVRCKACGRQVAATPRDVAFGCTCGGKGPGQNTYYSPDDAI